MTSLFVVLVLAAATFLLARPAVGDVFERGQYNRLFAVYLLVVTSAFLATSVWMYFAVLAAILLMTVLLRPAAQPHHLATAWGVLMVAVPAVPVMLPGFAGINNLFELNHPVMLTLLLLVPAALKLAARPGTLGFGRMPSDWFVLGYLLLQVGLMVGATTATGVMRLAWTLMLDIWLPYWVLSRAFESMDQLVRFATVLVLCGCIAAGVAMVEVVRSWPIYDAVEQRWGLNWGMTSFLLREGMLRARASTGHSLALGFTLIAMTGLALAVVGHSKVRLLGRLAVLVILGGLVASLARGAWVGTAVVILLAIAMSPRAGALVIGAIAAGAVVALLVMTVPAAREAVDFLPFIGTVDAGGVTYRQNLFDVAFALFLQSPWLGVPNYLAYMEVMRQGEGIIDLVNVYVAVGLASGLVGLVLYAGGFLLVMAGLLKVWRDANQPEGLRRWAALIVATLAGMMVMLATTSLVSIIGLLTYVVMAMGVTCLRLSRGETGVSAPLPARGAVA